MHYVSQDPPSNRSASAVDSNGVTASPAPNKGKGKQVQEPVMDDDEDDEEDEEEEEEEDDDEMEVCGCLRRGRLLNTN